MPVSDDTRLPIVRPATQVAPGLPGIWATGLATVSVLLMLVLLLWIVGINAFGWFWPARVWELTLDDGTVAIGEIVAREAAPEALGVTTGDRLQLKTGNRELTGSDFMWIDEARITRRTTPPDLVRVVRTEYGDAFGRIVAATGVKSEPVGVESRQDTRRLLAEGSRMRRIRDDLLDDSERVRRPLTRLEERLDLLERSDRAETAEGKEEISVLEQEVERMAAELGPRLDGLQRRLDEAVEGLYRAGLRLAAGAATLEIPQNRMGVFARVTHAAREGFLFLFTEPREADTEGGIFPALFGTVLLVLLMSVAVVPLGVITAVYMTEYARVGMLLRLANQAVNNLAGVPSIVFGMFGLAFFIYGVGGTMDRVLFADRLPTPTFGTGGVLWASLTLALLTVPVVVVATRESLLTVPRSWREGSMALGATQWQTLRRIILPAAMPGILTGLILAVGRAAGEVAPLMLTGAVKLAPSLPVDGSAPFLHLQRKFMHLGFHIYDVSMQSPNVEAAKPMAFATTLVLLVLVVLMNLTAIIIRRRLRRAYRGQVV